MQVLLPISSLFASASAINLSTVYQYPNGTWLENIVPMRNGSLLVTMIGVPEVHIINPTVSPATSNLVTSFPGYNAALGITELSSNKFAVAVQNVTPSNTPVFGTSTIWTMDFNACEKGKKVEVEKVAELKDAGLINGITRFDSHTILLADSWNGNIVRLDTKSKKHFVAFEDESLKSNFSAPGLQLGVNGVRYHDQTSNLYFSNTVQSLVGRVKLDHSGTAKGAFEVIANGEEVSQPDDFAVTKDGSVILARPLGDTLQRVGLNGKVEILAKRGLASGATSVVFGVGKGKGEKVLYLSESGLEGGVAAHGGRVVKVEL